MPWLKKEMFKQVEKIKTLKKICVFNCERQDDGHFL